MISEKTIKGFLTYHNKKFAKTHDLVTLLESCVEIDPDFANFYEHAANLNPYISRSRYPDDAFNSPFPDCIDDAEEILDFVKTK